MKTRTRLLLMGLLLIIAFAGFSALAQFNKQSPGSDLELQEFGNSTLKYSMDTNEPWAYIEVHVWNNMGLLEQDAKLLAELDKAVEATGKKCGEHIFHPTNSGVKGVLCKVEEK